ncbi:MAG TPA: 2Fe-2S iron-sulfur cluster-binding protein, partial [Caldilineaceae bacterium]|nr:2Fe-2S iron-sulfur cluster-binding protein [Caldilineaceae bacterium]
MTEQTGNSTQLTLTLDGETLPFTSGETIYEVAQRNGAFVPTLCYDPRLKPFGACRLCVVEVRGQRNPVAACTTPAVAGSEGSTTSEGL